MLGPRAELLFFTSMEKVKKAIRGAKISSKHQVTIPQEAMCNAGLEAGDRLTARADGPGRVVLEREVDILERYAGSLTGVYDGEMLAQLRDEWD
jgi:bifunctional DNA-binding transcriptional regulator/antitoxin component of YhaV-PrlF toxin-antitoxin module